MFYHWERVPGNHWIQGWFGPKAGLDTLNWKISSLPRMEPSFLGNPACSLVTITQIKSTLLGLPASRLRHCTPSHHYLLVNIAQHLRLLQSSTSKILYHKTFQMPVMNILVCTFTNPTWLSQKISTHRKTPWKCLTYWSCWDWN